MARYISLRRYRDFYGCYATLSEYRDGSARLVIYEPRGKVFHDKCYRSFRGARIAMGKLGDCWHEVI